MKLLFAADLHGDVGLYDQLAELMEWEQPAALLLGGDLLPYASRKDGPPIAFAEGPLTDFIRRAGIPVYATAGNHDWPEIMATLAARSVLPLLGTEPVALGPYLVQGYPCVTPTPLRRRDYERRDRRSDQVKVTPGSYVSLPEIHEVAEDYLQQLPSMEEELAGMVGGRRSIWVTHCPPWGGGLDVITGGGHVGSRALLAQIEAKQPLITLHGHIHESPAVSGQWAEWHGASLSINPGRGEQMLHAVLFEPEVVGEAMRHTVYGVLQ